MKFAFFTFGGALFWEDVFFYQKWRIQRHYRTKKYRLLDSWDICRTMGTFEKCQKAFVKYIESYEITKQPKNMVILLHGYMDSKNVFKRLWRKFSYINTNVVSLNYPSLFRDSVTAAHQLLFFLNHLEKIETVSFVTKGCGELILRQMFNLPLTKQKYLDKIRIKNIVTINPVSKENPFLDVLCHFKIWRKILGPMAFDMINPRLSFIPNIPASYKCLRIVSHSYLYFWAIKILFKITDKNIEITDNNEIFIKRDSLSLFKNDELLNFTIKFITNGKI